MVVVFKKVSEGYVMNAKAAKKEWPKAVVFDPTLGGAMEMFDPAFALGKIKVPGEKWLEAHSIMGIWEGLKIFSKKDVVDVSFMRDMKKVGKVRGCKSYGRMVGIKVGDEMIEGDENLKDFFRKLYKEVIGERFKERIEKLGELDKEKVIVLLDYPEGGERYPVSHVEILKELIENK